MSVVKYNGITLPYPLHSSFVMESVYDESNTDLMYTRIEAMVQCIVNKEFISIIDSSITADSPIINIMRAMRFKLLEPRKTLEVIINGRDLVPTKAGVVGTVDARNGPKPKSCTITQMSDHSFLVTYHIEGHYWENYSSIRAAETGTNRKGNAVISNRWSDTAEIDQCQFTRRTVEGKVFIRSDNAEGLRVDEIRNNFAIFGIPPGCVRKRAQYRVDPSGLAMSYTLEYEEQYLMPPKPAYEAEGEYTESTTNNGALRWGECRVMLKGAKDTPKDDLLKAALIIMMSKLRVANTKAFIPPTKVQADQGIQLVSIVNPLSILSNSSIRTSLYRNDVEVRARFMMGPNARTVTEGIATLDPRPVCLPPLGSWGTAPFPKVDTRGTLGLVLRAAVYFDPSLQQKMDFANGNMQPGIRVGEAGKIAW